MIKKANLTRILSAGVALSLMFSLASCKKTSLIADVSDDDTTSEATVTEEEKQPEKLSYNIYTGEYDLSKDAVGKRPVAVMINNIKASLPQRGIGSADIVYEMPVEGGFTRLMAVFADYKKAGTIGSVRSARHDFVEMADSLNAIFVHWGGSDYAYSSIRNNGVTDIDGMAYGETYFYTDNALRSTKAIEHCRFTTSELIGKAVGKLGIKEDSSSDSDIFNFNKNVEVISYLDSALNVSVKFSGDVTATFTYDDSTQKYIKGEYGANQMDANTNTPVSVSNVFILYAGVSYLSDGVHKDVDLSAGTGYYVTRGSYYAITWQKGNASQSLKLYDQNGNELNVNTGNSWVMFVPKNMSASTVIE